MKSAVVVFPGINRERDMMLALEAVTGVAPVAVWHTDPELPKVDLVVVPGLCITHHRRQHSDRLLTCPKAFVG